jgi:hypothetical protein
MVLVIRIKKLPDDHCGRLPAILIALALRKLSDDHRGRLSAIAIVFDLKIFCLMITVCSNVSHSYRPRLEENLPDDHCIQLSAILIVLALITLSDVVDCQPLP